ncbi:uncharacterized protein NEPG_01155 [Nematocida parisii ERTm1]|uniref:uncharacterized protein n=1 Tax=Nematocida parisii (strain ERTm1 / ATCC PRA-289) TaxID=881290 RepID=UPI000264B9FC|nr:uncharacterized protein NEPG_01155 [Nematocida parisii ERTm1]EIJ93583.1 hypothetical protein NEPG_01155 [Nematocida parisii ERTm1]|eukprot:XP_013058983.1 hypothetical protein NEPG_01155 [Nematocida parisii ERTm1]
MNGGQQNQSGYSSGFYGTSPLQRQSQGMYQEPYGGSNNGYQMHQHHGGFGSQIPDNSPIRILPNVPNTSIEPFSIRTKIDNNISISSCCITTLDAYSPYTLEELRCADYAKGRKGTIMPRTGFHSAYGGSSTYMQKPSDMMGSQSMFGQPKPASSPGFGSLSQPGYSMQPRMGGSSMFSPTTQPQSTSTSSLFGQPANTGNTTFGQAGNTSFMGQSSNSSFQQPQSSSGLGGFRSFGQSSTGIPMQQQNTFSSGLGTQQNNAMSNSFSNNSMLGSSQQMNQNQQSPMPGQQQSLFGGLSAGGMGNNTSSNQTNTGLLGQSTPSAGTGAFSMGGMGGASSNTSLFGQSTPSQNTLGGGLSSQPSAFSSLGASSSGLGAGAATGSTTNNAWGNTSSLTSGLNTAPSTGLLGGSSLGAQASTSGGLGSFSLGQSTTTTAGTGTTGTGLFGGLGGSKPENQTTSSPFSLGTSSILDSKPAFGSTLGGGLTNKPLESSSLDNKLSGFSSSFGAGSTSLLGGPSGGLAQAQSTSSFGAGSAFGGSVLGGSKPPAQASAAEDPYLIKSLSFKECEDYKKKSVMEIPMPLFKKAPVTKIKFKPSISFKQYVSTSAEGIKKNAEKKKLTRDTLNQIEENEYYTIPSISQIKKMPIKKISGFIVGRKGHGHLEFQEEVDLTNVNLDTVPRIVTLDNGYVFFSKNKDNIRPGHGINKAVKIYVENPTIYSHSTGRLMPLSKSDPLFAIMKARVMSSVSKDGNIHDVEIDLEKGVAILICNSLWA